MNARDIMTGGPVQSCRPNTPVRQVAEIMAENDIGSVPVTDDQGHVTGVVTDRDICCRLVASGRTYDTPVNQVMSPEVFSCHPDADLQEIEQIMREHRIRRVPVVDEQEHLQGIISQADLCHALHGRPEEHEVIETIEEISKPTDQPML